MPFKLLKYINAFLIFIITYIIINGVYTKYIDKSAYNYAEIIQIYLLNIFNISNEYLIGRNSSQQLLEIIRSTPLFLIITVVIKSFFINYREEIRINNKLNLILISFFLMMSALQIPFFYKWCQLITYIIIILGISDILSSTMDNWLVRMTSILSVIYISILFLMYLYSYYSVGGYFFKIKYFIIILILLLYFLSVIFYYYKSYKKIIFTLILVVAILIERILFYNYFFKYTYNPKFSKPNIVSSYSEIEIKSAKYLKNKYRYSDIILVTDPYTLSVTKGLTGFNGFYSTSNIEEMSDTNKKHIRLILKYILISNCNNQNLDNFKKSLVFFMKDSSLNHSEVSEGITRNQYPNIEPGKFDSSFFGSLLIIVTPRTIEWIHGNSSYIPNNSELDFNECKKYLSQVSGVDSNFLLFKLSKLALRN